MRLKKIVFFVVLGSWICIAAANSFLGFLWSAGSAKRIRPLAAHGFHTVSRIRQVALFILAVLNAVWLLHIFTEEKADAVK